jgi:hypothetical protein
MTSDEIMEQGIDVALLPISLAKRLPNRGLRFVGFVVATPCCMPFLLASVGWLMVGTLVSMWESAK